MSIVVSVALVVTWGDVPVNMSQHSRADMVHESFIPDTKSLGELTV
jgi:hypothetical protein